MQHHPSSPSPRQSLAGTVQSVTEYSLSGVQNAHSILNSVTVASNISLPRERFEIPYHSWLDVRYEKSHQIWCDRESYRIGPPSHGQAYLI
jgi:hypothetical protein